MESLKRDLRYVARSLSRSPGFFLITVFTLSLGIGATTSIFSVVNGVLLQPLPYPGAERIAQLFQIDKDGKRMSVSVPNFEDWKAQTRAFESMAVSQAGGITTVNGLAEPVRARATRGVTRILLGVRREAGDRARLRRRRASARRAGVGHRERRVLAHAARRRPQRVRSRRSESSRRS